VLDFVGINDLGIARKAKMIYMVVTCDTVLREKCIKKMDGKPDIYINILIDPDFAE